MGLNGTVEKASVSYIIRDHDADKFEQKKVFMWACVDLLKKKYGDEVLTLHASRTSTSTCARWSNRIRR